MIIEPELLVVIELLETIDEEDLVLVLEPLFERRGPVESLEARGPCGPCLGRIKKLAMPLPRVPVPCCGNITYVGTWGSTPCRPLSKPLVFLVATFDKL